MKRYFYKDPLAAAWMNLHFQMILAAELAPGYKDCVPVEEWDSTCGSVKEARFCELGVRTDLEKGNLWVSTSSSHRFYIHPDSLHLLEPQEGDLLKVWFSSPAVSGPLAIDHFVLGCPWQDVEFEMEYERHRILQRNGLAFHWPEAEA